MMPMRTIELSPEWHWYARWFRRFLQREIPFVPKYWNVSVAADRVIGRFDDSPEPTVKQFTVDVGGTISDLITPILRGQWINAAGTRVKLSSETSLLFVSSTSHRDQHLTLPDIDVEVAGMPDPVLEGVEPHSQGLLLHLHFKLTRAPFTVLVRFPEESA